tara:strand:- start:499 stop:930 length:432 start_codon:yes stop_codon:yes gene_type:complete
MKKLQNKIEKFLTKQGYENVTFNKTSKWSDEEYIEVRADHVTPAWTWDKPTKTFHSKEFGTVTIEQGEHHPEERENNDIFRIFSRGKVDGRNTYHITWAGVSDVMKYHLDSYSGTKGVFADFYYNTFDEIENYDQESADILAV